jgi:outer membrane protein TolC
LESVLPAETGTLPGPNPEDVNIGDLRLMRKLSLLRAQMDREVAVAGNMLLPDLDAIGGIFSQGQALNQPEEKNYIIKVQASYPLGSEKAQGELGQARAHLEEVKATEEVSRRTLVLTLFQANKEIDGWRKILDLKDAQVANALEKLELSKKQYDIGRLDVFYLVDVENALLNAKLQRMQTLLQLKRQLLSYLATSNRLLLKFPGLMKRITAEK